MKPGFSTDSHYGIRLQGRKHGVHQDTGFRAHEQLGWPGQSRHTGRGPQLPLARERSVSSLHLALPSPVCTTTVYEPNEDMMQSLDAQLRSEGF